MKWCLMYNSGSNSLLIVIHSVSSSTVTCPAFPSSLPRGSTECQPLVQAIGCSDCSNPSSSEGGTGGKLLGDCGECARVVPGGDPCNAAMVHCASGCQRRPQHLPIECTELDLEGYLSDVQSDCIVMAQETAAHYQPSRPQERPALTSGSVGPDACGKQSWMREHVEGRSEECHCIRCGNAQLYNQPTVNQWVNNCFH